MVAEPYKKVCRPGITMRCAEGGWKKPLVTAKKGECGWNPDISEWRMRRCAEKQLEQKWTPVHMGLNQGPPMNELTVLMRQLEGKQRSMEKTLQAPLRSRNPPQQPNPREREEGQENSCQTKAGRSVATKEQQMGMTKLEMS